MPLLYTATAACVNESSKVEQYDVGYTLPHTVKRMLPRRNKCDDVRYSYNVGTQLRWILLWVLLWSIDSDRNVLTHQQLTCGITFSVIK